MTINRTASLDELTEEWAVETNVAGNGYAKRPYRGYDTLKAAQKRADEYQKRYAWTSPPTIYRNTVDGRLVHKKYPYVFSSGMVVERD